MKSLIEMVGKRNGYKIIDIHNGIGRIDNYLNELCEAEMKEDIETIILIAIEYSLSLKIRMEYKDIFTYAQERR